MYEYTDARGIVRAVRERAALTQRELAARAGVAQPMVARLEAAQAANPSINTLAAVAAAAGCRLRVVVEPIEARDPVVEAYKRDVDRTLIRENLRRPLEERIRTLGEWQEHGDTLQQATRLARAAVRRGASGGAA